MISKKTKKVFTEILTVFTVEIRCSPKKKKKVFRLHMLISQCHFNGPPLELMGRLNPTAFLKPMDPLKSMGTGVILPLPPFSAALKSYKNNYLLVIYCLVKKNCASPTKSLTARHCYLVTAKSQKRKKQLYYPYTFFKPNFTSGLFWACFEVQTIFWVWA